MTLYLATVPNPAAGHDWTYTVPGQYIEEIVSVTATLNTTAAPTTATDSSGNNNNATYAGRANVTYGVTGPFGAGGGLALDADAPVNVGKVASFANAGGQFDTATFTCEAIVWIANLGAFFSLMEILAEKDPSLATRFIFGVQESGGLAQMRCVNNQFSAFNLGSTFSLAAWHHLAVTYTGGTWTPYLDGVAGTAVSGNNIDTTVHNQTVAIAGDPLATTQWYNGKLAAVAYYGGVLAGANITNHFNAIATSSAAYKTAVLVDSPVALWMLDQTLSTSGRTPSLQVTDGRNTVGLFTPGIQPAGSGSPFTYSWLNDLSTNVQPPGTSVISAALPDLILPAGYTIGTSTPDIQPTDQWSNIVIWWSSSYMDNVHNYQPFQYPPGACLQYRQVVP